MRSAGHARCDSRFSLSTSTMCDRSCTWRVDGFNMGSSGHGSCVITFHTFSRERCATTLREAEDEGGSVGGGRGGGREEIEWVYMGTLRDGEWCAASRLSSKRVVTDSRW